ncbi:MAG: type IIL restriction-modification enzyme MmeI, partial [Xanthobacteraceae bacterium]
MKANPPPSKEAADTELGGAGAQDRRTALACNESLLRVAAMTPLEFIRKWKPVSLTERATAQTHFIDLCALVGHPDPVSVDPTGESFTFEKGALKTGGGDGFADVWKKGFFAWEYKKKKRNLDEALAQLVRYAAALENPPLQVACDTDRFQIRTAWTNAVPKTYELSLEDIGEPQNLKLLHSVFFEPEKLRPTETRAAVTKEAADQFSTIASRLETRGTREQIAHFVNQLVFCFFANSVKLL